MQAITCHMSKAAMNDQNDRPMAAFDISAGIASIRHIIPDLCAMRWPAKTRVAPTEVEL
jgi:hypothetical protein